MTRSSVFPTVLPATLTVALTTTAFAGGGDDAFTAIEIPALPFAVDGDTSDNTDQFDVACPFTGSTAPDAWYSYTVTETQKLVVDLCESQYDTKVYVLDTSFNEIACNDDACSDSNGNPFRSLLETRNIPAGTQVYIVVDGYSGEFGAYSMGVEAKAANEPCLLICPDGALPEGEDAGGACDETIDTNGGCGSTGIDFRDVTCGDTICGIAWANGGIRDTDWYRLSALDQLTSITWDVVGEFDGAFFYLGEDPECSTVVVEEVLPPDACESASLTISATGETWWFVAVDGFDGVPCGAADPFGNDYVVSWSCNGDPQFPCPTLGDVDLDGVVDFNDLLIVLANFGDCP